MPSQIDNRSSLLLTVATRSDGEVSSTSRPPCKTSIMIGAGQRAFSRSVETYAFDLDKIICRVNPQHLDCNMATPVFTLPDVSIPTTI